MKKFTICSFLLLATFACQKEDEQEPFPKTQTEITLKASIIDVKEAKKWFEDNINTPTDNRIIKWNQALTDNDSETIYVPISFKSKKILSKEERFRLIIYKDDKGNRKARFVHLIAESEYYKKNNKIIINNFTGLAIVYTWDEQFLYGLKYNNALPTGLLSKDDIPSTKNKNVNKTLASSCAIVTIVWYSQACAGGVCYNPVEVSRESYVMCSSDNGGGSIGYPDGNNPAGGGTGGGTGGTDCGDAIICEDGSTNPALETNTETIVKSPELLAFEQEYRTHMSQHELQIFDGMTVVKQVAYLLNAQNAMNLANTQYASSTLDGNGDAVRHAYFAANNVRTIGADLTQQLFDAHEELPGQTPAQIQMDTFNNLVGKFIGLGTGDPLLEVQNKLASGGLKIIENGQVVPSHL